ncbi:MAG: hypothetical protein HY689_03540 [Chloroflexi bacterium]|nr:hypothetical protein [Chloroflexota bacterium]
MEREEFSPVEQRTVLGRPRIAEVEAFLEEPWHVPALRDEAQQKYEAWIALARAGLVRNAESCLTDVWELKRQDHLASFLEFAERTGIPLHPLDYVEPSQVQRGVYWIVWRERPGQSWAQRVLKRVGQHLAGKLPWMGGRFRMYPLRHAGTMERLQRFPPEVANWAYLLGQRAELEEAVVFEQVFEPDPILAVLVGGRWFEITRWE